MLQVDNIIIQVRAKLQSESIKLWLEPYYYADIGSVESEIERLAEDFSQSLGISVTDCKLALNELQEGALRKLDARKEFETTGLATFNVRRIDNKQGTQNITDVKCALSALGLELQEIIANKLNLSVANQVKCISAGRILEASKTLAEQGLKNNQQLMVIISELKGTHSDSNETLYDRIGKIKTDVEKIIDSKRQLFEMEDQDGNTVFLPPEENRALLFALGYCEKARVAMKRRHYDESLILLLEADEKFTSCNSKFLESVDNYALVNLDIVWCYLCLKNVTQLPDAQRRLEICEKSFRRSYGENMKRLYALKGNACPERVLIMRLHLLQGVVFFHQNRRNEALDKLTIAAAELNELKVDDTAVQTLVEMGYAPFEARLALRSCNGNIERAIVCVHERQKTKNAARARSKKERAINEKLSNESNDKDWVNPRSVCTLLEMGFSRKLVVEALRRSKNDVQQALDLLQLNGDELQRKIPATENADDNFVDQLKQLGFSEEDVRVSLETNHNNLEKSVEFLVKMFGNEQDLKSAMEQAVQACSTLNMPSTSTGVRNNFTSLLDTVMEKANAQMASMDAYNRFSKDLPANDEDYLDLELVQEEKILAEYRHLLQQ